MASFYLIIPVAVLFSIIAIAAWLWAMRSGQYDDLDREARRILEDENPTAQEKSREP
jgi:cbb3-type cytochrome oxidase maturation protein